MLSQPAAAEGEDRLRPYLISLPVRGSAKGFRDRPPLGGRGYLTWKKWSRRALLMETGWVAHGRERNLGVFLGGPFCQEVCPVGCLGPFNGREVPWSGLFGEEEGGVD